MSLAAVERAIANSAVMKVGALVERYKAKSEDARDTFLALQSTRGENDIATLVAKQHFEYCIGLLCGAQAAMAILGDTIK